MDLLRTYTVAASPTKLTLQSGSSARYLHLPLFVLHREPVDGGVCFVLHSPEMGNTVVHVELADLASQSVLDRLPKKSDPAAVQRALAAPTAQRVTVLELPEVPGRIEFDGQIVTVFAGDERFHLLVGRDELPVKQSSSMETDGSMLLQIEMRGVGQRRLRVPPSSVLMTEKSLLLIEAERMSARASAPSRWEYRLVKNMLASSLEDQLNQLGRDGWEVVALTGLDGVMTLTGNKLMAVLKRPLRGR